MKYFVSIENTSYFYWQVELLIESFLMLGMENDLVIGIAENESQKVTTFSKNLVRHPHKFIHNNIGEKEGYMPLNRFFGIRCALATGAISYPFTVIHADMVLRSPIKLTEEDEICGALLNNFDTVSDEETSEIKTEIAPSLKALSQERKVDASEIPEIPFVSWPVVLNKPAEYISDVFLSRLQISTTDIFKRRGAEFPCEKAAWNLTLAESFQHFPTKGKFMSGPILHEYDNLNFIHYSSGIPPVFHKMYYRYKDKFYLSGSDPYQVLLDSGATTNADYVKSVVRSYNKRNRV